MPEFAKICFPLKQDEDGYPDFGSEGIWGIVQGGANYVVNNIPWYVYGVSKGDVVLAEEDDGVLTARFVIAQNGHSTLRVFVADAATRRSYQKRLNALGAFHSSQSPLSLFAVDIPPDADFGAIDSWLAGVSNGDTVAYEDACLQHPGIEQDRLNECLSRATIPGRFN